VILLLLCTCPPASIADESQIGVATFPVLELPFGARGAAMGAFCGLADDITAIWWNPGGLGQIERAQAHFCHQEWFQSFRDEYAATVFPTYLGTIGGSFLYSNVTGIEAGSEDFQKMGNFKTYEAVLALAYARELKELKRNLFVGLTLQALYQNLDPEILGVPGDKGKAMCSSIGVLWRGKKISAGGSIQNIGTTVSYYNKSSEFLPRTLKIGTSFFPRENLIGVFDINVPQFGEINYHLGGEYWISKDFLALRAGYNSGPQSKEYFGFLDALSAGFGIRFKDIGSRYVSIGDMEIDYAYSSYGDLGMTHRINLNWMFGMPGIAKTGVLAVKCFDSQTKKPLQAIITTDGTLIDTVVTSPADGKITIQEVPIGMVYITTHKDFYEERTDTFFLMWNETAKIEVPLKYLGPEGVPADKLVREGICGRLLLGKLTEKGIVEPLKEGIVSYEGPVSGTVVADTEGWYKIPDIPQGNYTLTAESEKHDYFPVIIENVTVEHEKATLLHCTLKRMKILKLYFERDRAYIHPSEYGTLDELAEFMLRYEENEFEIHGHTDPRPPRRFKNNIELSKARASAVRKYLVKKGISEGRLAVEGWGDKKPIAENDTEEGMALNRRIEIIIKPRGEPLPGEPLRGEPLRLDKSPAHPDIEINPVK